MKALRKLEKGYNNMQLLNLSEPNPTVGELKLHVLFTGICGSDIHAFKGKYNKKIPLTIGHEFVGEVVAIGDTASDFSIGDIVVSETTFETCGTCIYCQRQEFNLCSNRRGIGTQVDGSFAEYLLVKSARCHLVPKEIDLKIAALLEPLACCFHAIQEKTTVSPHEKIAVFGPGPIGVLLSIILFSQGVDVLLIGIEKDKKRLALAKELGIPHTLINSENQLEEFVDGWTNSLGVDQVFECSGNIHAVHQAMKILKKQGTLVQEGLFATPENAINMDDLIHKELCYIGSRTQKPSSWKLAIDWLIKTDIDLHPIISTTLPLTEWQTAFDLAMDAAALKILLVP